MPHYLDREDSRVRDGAFFTKPVPASIAAYLTLEVCGEQDWTNPDVWLKHKTVDLACGNGRLLLAILREMKKRAIAQGATDELIKQLQKLAVENIIKGMDINPTSIQTAITQLKTEKPNVDYQRMGFHLMPYGPYPEYDNQVFTGTLELLGQKNLVPRHGELDFGNDIDLNGVVDDVKDARIMIMNPPFIRRTKIGEQFTRTTQKALRDKIDLMEQRLINVDPDMKQFINRRSIASLFIGLADHCLNHGNGVLTMVVPTTSLTTMLGINERFILAQRYHIHTILTCHAPKQTSMSEYTGTYQSIVVATRNKSNRKKPTRFIQLDKMPQNEKEVNDLNHWIAECSRR